jgi:hypothetical protein
MVRLRDLPSRPEPRENLENFENSVDRDVSERSHPRSPLRWPCSTEAATRPHKAHHDAREFPFSHWARVIRD